MYLGRALLGKLALLQTVTVLIVLRKVAFDETRASIAFTPTPDTYLTYAQLGGDWTEPAVSSASTLTLAWRAAISWTLLYIVTGSVT